MQVLRPTQYEQDQALDAYARRAEAEGILLRGHQGRASGSYFVVAFRAETQQPLEASFAVTYELATDYPLFCAALDQLLLQAKAELVRTDEQNSGSTLQ